MTGWGVGCMRLLGGTLDGSNLAVSKTIATEQQRLKLRPTEASVQRRWYGKPDADTEMGETAGRLAKVQGP